MTEIEKKFFDPNINRKAAISDKNLIFFKNSKIPMPSVIEISNSGMCNRKCAFCPRSAPDYKDVNEFITDELNELQEALDCPDEFTFDYIQTIRVFNLKICRII